LKYLHTPSFDIMDNFPEFWNQYDYPKLVICGYHAYVTCSREGVYKRASSVMLPLSLYHHVVRCAFRTV
ncbi:hypothetical protein L9F63_005858, partial [Diploptera punctata]